MSVLDLRAPASRFEVAEWPDLSSAERREQLTPAALRGLARLGPSWHLSGEQVRGLLGGIPPSTWHAWKACPPADLTTDRLTRISLLLGMYTALHVLHQGPLADEWIRRPNSNLLFGGRPPVDVMIAGGIPAMLEVRALLDGRRGGL